MTNMPEIMNFWDERNPARAAIMHELNHSVSKDVKTYCDQIGSYRLILMAYQYGCKSDVVQLVEWLIGKGCVVVLSGLIKNLRDVPGYSNEYLDELRKKLASISPSRSVIDERIDINRQIKEKIRRDKKVQGD